MFILPEVPFLHFHLIFQLSPFAPEIQNESANCNLTVFVFYQVNIIPTDLTISPSDPIVPGRPSIPFLPYEDIV